MTQPARLSACIVSFDEEDRIGDCLRSLAFCDEIVVVDSHSTDRTVAIARELGAKVIERDWPGFRDQKSFAYASATHDWILSLDADERVSATLAREIADLRARGFDGRAGFEFPRLTSYLGRWIRRGGWYPDRQLKLFDRRRHRFTGNEPHPRVEVDGAVGQLAGDLFHEAYRSFGDHLATIDRYTSIMASDMRARGKRASVAKLVLSPLGHLFKFLVLKRGVLDGWRGILIAVLSAYYGWLKYAKLWVLERATPTVRPTDAQPGTFERALRAEEMV